MNGYPPPPYPQYPPQYQPQQQGWGPPQIQQPQYYPQAQPQPMMPQAPQQLPAVYLPNDQAEMERYRKAKEEQASWGANSDGPKFVSIPGPRGEEKWSQVQIGAENNVSIWILPPVVQGHPLSVEVRSHFWKSNQFPKGKGIDCGGANCLVCKVRELGLAYPDDQVQKKVKEFTRTRKKNYYNVALISDPKQHAYPNGTYRSLILSAGSTLFTAIGDIIDHCGGVSKVIDPQNGRQLRIKKRKNGPLDMDVEYSVQQFDPGQLPQAFWFLLDQRAQWDLTQFGKAPSQDDQMRAVEDMGFGFLLRGGSASYNPAPSAPYPNPYAPPMPQPTQPWAPPQQSFAPMQTPPQQWSPSPPMMASAPLPPPQFNPPPISSGPPVVGYQPQVGQVSAPPPVVQSVTSSVVTTPIELRRPLPPSVQLPDGRERCFGSHSAGDRMCQSCPDWIKNQCIPQSAVGAPQIPAASAELAALTAALQGTPKA